MVKSSSEKYHNKGLQQIVERLESKGFDAIFTNLLYGHGELDILGIKNNNCRYYEIKGHHSKVAYRHAKDQFKRVGNAFPNLKIKYIYVPLDGGIRRYKP